MNRALNSKKQQPRSEPGLLALLTLRRWLSSSVELVAGYCGFCFGLFDLGCAVAVRVAVAIRLAIAVCRSDLHWLHRYAGNRAQDLLH